MPIPDHFQSKTSYISSEQVVPFEAVSSEGTQLMEAELPNEKGAAALEQKFLTADKVPKDLTEKVCNEDNPNGFHSIGEATQQSTQNSKPPENNTVEYAVNTEHQACSDIYNLDLNEGLQRPTDQYQIHVCEESSLHGSTQFFHERTKPHPWCDRYPIEVDTDMGYSSHSACSSCQHGSQADSAQNNMTFSEVEYTDDCLNGDEEMEDLLFHFDRFFRNRYEEILTEQEMHVRQIVKKVIKTCGEKDCFTDSIEVTDKATQTDKIEKFTVPSIIIDESSCQACDRSEQHNQTIIKPVLPQDCVKNRQLPVHKDKLLLKIMSLTCAISNLLQRKEYKT